MFAIDLSELADYSSLRESYILLWLPNLDPNYPGESLSSSSGDPVGLGIAHIRKQIQQYQQQEESTKPQQEQAPATGLEALDKEVGLRLAILQVLTRRHFRVEVGITPAPEKPLDQDKVNNSRIVVISRRQ